ncbi:hypothetical protein MGYG_08978 [Nannizzia gypsea CBS 118893]|uniref:Pfs domain-containing protein n=1 Tax=Arthroderma gypseum (strain ATCC MYA-4604 / CBS 118893) TaxID=535722 RepID=E4UMM7_ARTGP|nr:hypothetical protein MGYG_08978 [Nannizzia gypsea CBS 118893]EFQ99444.1 hypothetical protein MGYG_08978 [Nannizzia gypsea CBS 118893]
MASCNDYTVGWVCTLPIEVAAAKATLDRVYNNSPLNRNLDDNNSYVLGSLQGHNAVIAYPDTRACGKTSVADVTKQLHASYTSIQLNLMVGIARGVPDTKEDIRLGDVVVSKSTAGAPGVAQYDVDGGKRTEDWYIGSRGLDLPTPLLLTAMGKAETAAIFDESKMSQYISEIVQKDPVTFARPGPEQDTRLEPNYDHTTVESEGSGYSHCDPDRVRSQQHREAQGPVVHYGLIASSPPLSDAP